jgi:RNA polymerase sigma-70 factor (ECF subfamily)
MARRYMARERRDNCLQPTALVNEAYLRLVNVRRVDWRDRAHFLAVAARVMRQVLVDTARSRKYQKRSGAAVKVSIDPAVLTSADRTQDMVALDDALQALAAFDRRKSHVVELRFFGGLSVGETAAVLNVSADTVMRDWRLAKAWLKRELRRD